MCWGRGLVISWLTNVLEVPRPFSHIHKMASKALSSTFRFKADRRRTRGRPAESIAFVQNMNTFPEVPLLLPVNYPLGCTVRTKSCDPTPCCKEGWERREQVCHDWCRSIVIYH